MDVLVSPSDSEGFVSLRIGVLGVNLHLDEKCEVGVIYLLSDSAKT